LGRIKYKLKGKADKKLHENAKKYKEHFIYLFFLSPNISQEIFIRGESKKLFNTPYCVVY